MEVLSPGVQHSEEADRRAQTLGIGGDSEQRFRCGAKQDAVDLARILQCQAADLSRQRKDDVEVRDRQAVRLPFRPAIWRAPWLGILGNACCGTNYTR